MEGGEGGKMSVEDRAIHVEGLLPSNKKITLLCALFRFQMNAKVSIGIINHTVNHSIMAANSNVHRLMVSSYEATTVCRSFTASLTLYPPSAGGFSETGTSAVVLAHGHQARDDLLVQL